MFNTYISSPVSTSSKICLECKKAFSFNSYPSRLERTKYCSNECKWRNSGGQRGDYFKLGGSISEKHKLKLIEIGKELTGENARSWKGGTSRAYKTGYYSIEYRRWRESVFKRDNYTCQECGGSEYVTAHHIKSFAHYSRLRYELTNGVTLCESCHSRTDNYKGRNKKLNN